MNFYIYKVEHIETKEFYIGSRGCKCIPEEDKKYLGSMSVWKPDKSKLIKWIILKNFKTRSDAFIEESKLISENIDNPLNRNYHIPNKGYNVYGHMSAKDSDGNTLCISVDDIRLKSGELVGVNKGIVTAKDIHGNKYRVSNKDERLLSGELEYFLLKRFPVKDKNDNMMMIYKNDIRFLNGELVSINKGMVNVKDREGNRIRVSISDERYINGELVSINKGLPAYNKGVHMKEEQKEKLRQPKTEDHKKKLSISKLGKCTKPIICLNDNNVYSMKEASVKFSLTIPNIVNVLKGRASSTKGFYFIYQ